MRVVGTGQPSQQHHAGADGVHAGRESLVRQGLPGGEQCHRIAVHPAQLRGQIVGFATGRRDHQQRPVPARGAAHSRLAALACAREGACHEQLGTGRTHHRQFGGVPGSALGKVGEVGGGQRGGDQTGQRRLNLEAPAHDGTHPRQR